MNTAKSMTMTLEGALCLVRISCAAFEALKIFVLALRLKLLKLLVFALRPKLLKLFVFALRLKL